MDANVVGVREFESSDAAAVRALLADSAVTMPFFGRALAAEELDRRMTAQWGDASASTQRRIVACAHADGRLVGAGLRRGAEIGWFVAPDWWRRGVATALVQRLCLDPEAAFARVHRDNVASIRLVEKLGFRFSGLMTPQRAAFDARARLRYEVPRRVAR